MALVVSGRLAPMVPGAEEETFTGRLWLGDDGLVEAVTRQGERGPSGFATAPRVEVGGAVVHPGFIDLHSHLAYNCLPLWSEPRQTEPFLHHDIWPDRPSYNPEVSWPAWALMDRAPECVYAYVQARAIAGGTTTIQGWPSASRPPVNRLLRSVDDDRVGARPDPVSVSALTLDREQLKRRAEGLRAGQSFIYHCGEGQPGSNAAKEFDTLSADTWTCLHPGFIAVHCSALGAEHFAEWRRRARPRPPKTAGTVVWSPFSNLWLYGTTTAVPEVVANRIGVCLGTDWGPSGTKNLLGELKVARLWSDRQEWDLTDHELVRMITSVPGDAIARAWRVPLGRLVPGALADVTVVARRHRDPWRNLVRARDDAIELVVSSGRPQFGTPARMTAAAAGATTSVSIGGSRRRLALVRPDDPSRPWAWTDVRRRLDAVRADVAARPPTGPSAGRARRPAAPSPVAGDPPGTAPLVVRLDMPGGGRAAAGPPPRGQRVTIPPIEPLHHDRRWLASIPGRGFHGDVLDGLGRFYRDAE